MQALGVVKVGRRDNWLGYGERARADYPERVYISIRKGPKPEDARAAIGASRRSRGPRSTRSGMRGSPPAAAMTVRPACATIIASYYAAFLRDPDGNRIEAVCHHAV